MRGQVAVAPARMLVCVHKPKNAVVDNPGNVLGVCRLALGGMAAGS